MASLCGGTANRTFLRIWIASLDLTSFGRKVAPSISCSSRVGIFSVLTFLTAAFLPYAEDFTLRRSFAASAFVPRIGRNGALSKVTRSELSHRSPK